MTVRQHARRLAASGLIGLVALPILIARGSCAAGNMEGLESFLGPDGMLLARLELTETQEGFAGVSGTSWTIERDGAFRIARFLNEKMKPPHKSGQLTAEQLAKLAQALSARDFLGLPSELGPQQPVNPRRLSVSFGSKVSTLVLAPGQDPEEAATNGQLDTMATRLVAISRTIRSVVDGSSP